MPNILMLRLADGNETAGAYQVAILNTKCPLVLALSRQKLPKLHGTAIEKVEKGGYILSDNSSNNKPDDPSGKSYNNLREFSITELKTATRNFSRALMIGEGGFGGVYRAVIRKTDGSGQKIDVAVKQLSRRGLQGHKEWVTEVNVLGFVDHPNLVKLVGYSSEDDERGIQRLLVYEYMHNRSVQDHLSRFQKPLPWSTRLKIAQDAATGLAYLHEGMEFQNLFAAEEKDLLEWTGDILAVGVTEKDMKKDENLKFENPILKEVDSMLGGLLSKVCIEKDFRGKTGESTGVWSKNLGLGIKWVILVGLGNTTPPSTSDLCVFGEYVASVAKASQANTVAIALASSEGLTSQQKLATASAIAKGIFRGTHEVNRFNSDSKKLYLKSVVFFGLGSWPELEKKLSGD